MPTEDINNVFSISHDSITYLILPRSDHQVAKISRCDLSNDKDLSESNWSGRFQKPNQPHLNKSIHLLFSRITPDTLLETREPRRWLFTTGIQSSGNPQPPSIKYPMISDVQLFFL
jgi:hypothetical protein